jgi:hypothetical protein
MQKFRVRHHREYGKNVPVTLQNRVIEAASAIDALRTVLSDPAIRIQAIDDRTASATRKLEKHVDFWEADCEVE